MIEAIGLTKRYGSTLAVDDLSFTVRPGVVTGFLGPNGAGKSTTMRMILGLDNPTSGSATIDGQPYAHLKRPLTSVGALLDANWIHPNRSARSHLRFMAAANKIDNPRVDEVLDTVGLASVANKAAGKFSLGMKQRLGIAGALLGDPGVLLFDEPVNGLDPEGIHWIRNLMTGLAAKGRTVFVSSHLLSEMAQTAEHLVVIGRGRLIADCSTEDFIARATQTSIRVRSPQLDGSRIRAHQQRDRGRAGRRGASGDGRPDRTGRRARRGGARHAARTVTADRVSRGGLHPAHRRRGRVRHVARAAGRRTAGLRAAGCRAATGNAGAGRRAASDGTSRPAAGRSVSSAARPVGPPPGPYGPPPGTSAGHPDGR